MQTPLMTSQPHPGAPGSAYLKVEPTAEIYCIVLVLASIITNIGPSVRHCRVCGHFLSSQQCYFSQRLYLEKQYHVIQALI